MPQKRKADTQEQDTAPKHKATAQDDDKGGEDVKEEKTPKDLHFERLDAVIEREKALGQMIVVGINDDDDDDDDNDEEEEEERDEGDDDGVAKKEKECTAKEFEKMRHILVVIRHSVVCVLTHNTQTKPSIHLQLQMHR